MMKKRLLSLAIAICMVAAMLPTMALTAGAEGETYNKFVYRFTSYPYGYADNDTQTWYDPSSDEGITYYESYGMISYRDSNNITYTNARADARLEITFGTSRKDGENVVYENTDNAWIAFDINVPVSDCYNIVYTGGARLSDSAYGDAYILSGDENLTDIETAKQNGIKLPRRYVNKGTVSKYQDLPISYLSSSLCTAGNDPTIGSIYLEKGTHTLLLTCITTADGTTSGTDMASNKIHPVSLTLESATIPENATLSTPYTGVVSLSKDIVSLQDTEPVIATAVAAYIPDGTVAYTKTKTITKITDLTFTSSNESVATVENGSIVLKSEGETVISARKTGDISSPNGILPATLTVTAPEEDQQFAEEFGAGTYETDENKAFGENTEATVNVYTATLGEAASEVKVESVNRGEVFTVTAEDKTEEGLTFLYWVKGLSDKKQILTRDRTLEFIPTVEASHVIAVYEPTSGATVSGENFYNANGQLLTDVGIKDDKMPS